MSRLKVFDKVRITGEFLVLDDGSREGNHHVSISSDLENYDRLEDYSARSRFRIIQKNVQKIENTLPSDEEKELILRSRRLQRAIIVDIDGTISHISDRSPYDYSKVIEDFPDYPILDIIYQLSSNNYKVLFVTGRPESCRKDTISWIRKYVPCLISNEDNLVGNLFMRKLEDNRTDVLIKREIFFEHIVQNNYVKYVFEDRTRNVIMWRNLGLKCLQVANGDF